MSENSINEQNMLGTFAIPQGETIVDAETFARRVQFALSLSKVVAGTAVIAMIVMGVVWWFAQEYTQLLLFDAIVIPLTICSILFQYLARRGQAVVGFYIFLLSFMVVVFFIPLLISELLTSAGLAYLLLIVLGNALLGDRVGRWMLVGCVAAMAVDIFLVGTVARDWFPALDATAELAVMLFVNPVAVLGCGLIVRLIVLGQEEQFQVTRLAQREIEKRVVAEQAHREQLQRANQEIEARVASEQQQRKQLQALITQVQALITSLNGVAVEIQAASTQQLASATEQDSAVTQTVATVEEVRTTVEQTAERAQSVVEAAKQSVTVSQQGEAAVNDTVAGMTVIRQRVENIAETILALSDRTQQIGEIIETVNALADQSKLLALNASIEAARAGEEGRGFAVVALEVRQLAEQSRQATARVHGILSEIQQATNTAVMVTEEGSKGAERGMELVARAGEAIRELAATLAEVTQAAAQIAASTHQQTNGMDQLANAMQQIKQASTQASASSRQTEQSMRDLTHMAQQLKEATVS